MSTFMGESRHEFERRWEAVSAEIALREFRNLAHRTGIVESYVASYRGGGIFQELLSVRVDRYCDRCEITAQVFELNERGDWRPAQTHGRPLTVSEWEQVRDSLEPAFWRQPSRDAACPVMDGDSWSIEGYQDDNYHEVRRHTGSLVDGNGAEVYQLGKRLTCLAGLGRFLKEP